MTTDKIVVFTTDELREFTSNIVRETIEAIKNDAADILPEKKTEYRYGLRGIREMFGVCHTTAQIWKDTFLKPAVEQRGRKIRINVALAEKLFQEHNHIQ